MWLSDRSYVEVGKEHSQDHKNDKGISSGKLHHGGMCNPIAMDHFTTRDQKHTICVCRSGEASPGKKIALSILRIIEISPTFCENLKSNSGQERWLGPTKLGDLRQ